MGRFSAVATVLLATIGRSRMRYPGNFNIQLLVGESEVFLIVFSIHGFVLNHHERRVMLVKIDEIDSEYFLQRNRRARARTSSS